MLKKLILTLCLSLASTAAFSAAERYTLDTTHTTVAFLVEHIGFAKTLGYFSDVSGTLVYDDATGAVSSINIVVKTSSVKSDNKARDKHLRKKDFLSVKKHPKMTFTADTATVGEGGLAIIKGQLALLGKTQPLTLTATLNKTAQYPFGHKKMTLGISARGALNRSDYGMDYGVANGLVGDAVELIIETEAVQN